MPLAIFPVILCNILFNAAAQIALKNGMTKIGAFHLSWHNLPPLLLQVAINPWIILGLSLYVISVLFWLFVLSRVDVGMAYPLSSLAYVVNVFAAYYLLGENFSMLRLAGTAVILIGVFMVARS